MTKHAFILISLFSAVSAFAGVSDIAPSKDKISPAEVEKVYNVRAETTDVMGIKLIQADNGGSTDVSAFMMPSRLYLAFHLDGEMFNIEGNYLIAEGMVRVTSVKLVGDRIQLAYVYRTDELKEKTAKYTVLIGEALKEAKTAHSEDFVDYTLKSTVGLQNANP